MPNLAKKEFKTGGAEFDDNDFIAGIEIKDAGLKEQIAEAKKPGNGFLYYVAMGTAQQLRRSELVEILSRRYAEYEEEKCEDFLAGSLPDKFNFALSSAENARLEYKKLGDEDGIARTQEKIEAINTEIERRSKLKVVKNEQ